MILMQHFAANEIAYEKDFIPAVSLVIFPARLFAGAGLF